MPLCEMTLFASPQLRVRNGAFLFAAALAVWAQPPRDVSVELSADARESPPRITLQWERTGLSVTA